MTDNVPPFLHLTPESYMAGYLDCDGEVTHQEKYVKVGTIDTGGQTMIVVVNPEWSGDDAA